MSKIISDEEILTIAPKRIMSLNGYIAVAQAQRDSSDREWIEAIDEMINTYMFGDSSFTSFQDKYQALKQKVTGE